MKLKLFVKNARRAAFAGGFFFCLLSRPVSAEDRPKIGSPSNFKVRYALNAQAGRPSGGALGAPGLSSTASADIAVNILDERFFPLRTFVLKGVTSQDRVETLWDGRNVYGKEMPAGNYYASLSIVYSDGRKETRFFRFAKE